MTDVYPQYSKSSLSYKDTLTLKDENERDQC